MSNKVRLIILNMPDGRSFDMDIRIIHTFCRNLEDTATFIRGDENFRQDVVEKPEQIRALIKAAEEAP